MCVHVCVCARACVCECVSVCMCFFTWVGVRAKQNETPITTLDVKTVIIRSQSNAQSRCLILTYCVLGWSVKCVYSDRGK